MPPPADALPLTTLLNRSSEGDPDARILLWDSIYADVRRIARRACSAESAAGDIQPTLVVHEAYLKLFGGMSREPRWENRRHFWGAVSRAIGQVLVDLSRARRARRRGGALQQLELGDQAAELASSGGAPPTRTEALVAALDALEAASPECAHVARLRFLAGLSVEETAAVLGIAPRTVVNRWRYARAWLRRALADSNERMEKHGNPERPTA